MYRFIPGRKQMGNFEITSCIEEIGTRSLPAGGFAEQTQGLYRPDSTAWAVLAFKKAAAGSSHGDNGRAALASGQLKDGRVYLPPGDAIWPTPLAVFAWHGDPQYQESQNRAVELLLKISGTYWSNTPNDPVEHDSSLRGWSWVLGTHSFVEPTAMALLALEITRNDSHARFPEGIRLLLNRQLPQGGWNYGNTRVYGKVLLPFIDTTGMALTALAGHTSEESVKNSINYLRGGVEKCRTPLSLGWALLGLGAWGIFPDESGRWIEQTLARQEKFGPYGTSLLSLLALAFLCRGDFRQIFSE